MQLQAQTFVTFAYGSNMLEAQISERCSSAKPLGVAELHGYELKWHKASKDDSGKCDVVQGNLESVIYGVLYSIDSSQLNDLDRAEGRGNGYERKELEVIQSGSQIKAWVYCATSINAKLKPYDWYKAFVVAGAKGHNLPQSYIEGLEAIEAIPDSNTARASEKFAKLNLKQEKA